eukprot:Em0001g1315a
MDPDKPATTSTCKPARQFKDRWLTAFPWLLFEEGKMFCTAGRPFSDMEWMCALDEKIGFDVGASYRTDRKFCELIHCIVEEQRLGLQAQIQSNNFFSVMMDGTTDSSVSDAEIIYIRQGVKGVVAVKFLAYVNISRGTADHICTALVQALESNLQMTKETIFSKLVRFGSDGAFVMTGCKSGVSTRLKREQPLLFSMLAHRQELGFKAVVGANSFMTTFSELLFSIYNFYHSSALNRENLKSSCAAAGVKFLAPSRVWWYKVAASHHAGTKEAVEYVSSPNAALRAAAGVSSDSKAKKAKLKADMKCLVDGLTAQLEKRLINKKELMMSQVLCIVCPYILGPTRRMKAYELVLIVKLLND